MIQDTKLDWQYTCLGKPVYIEKSPEEHVLIGYIGCGNVLNPLIDDVPRDGVLHWITCSKCGTPTPVTKTPFAEAKAK